MVACSEPEKALASDTNTEIEPTKEELEQKYQEDLLATLLAEHGVSSNP